MAIPAPASFEPLASSNPVPADTDALTSLGAQYTATAQQIEDQATTLQNLSSNSSDSWKSKAGTVFVSKASDLATRITQAEQRYKTAGAALTNAAGPMSDAQQQAYAAVAKAQDAQQTMSANAPAPTPPVGSPPPTADQQAAAATAASNYSAASDDLAAAQASFNSAVDDYEAAAKNAAKTINDELGHDPLKDSWFEAHFEWFVNFFKWLAVAIMILGVIALLIACPFSAGILAAVLGVSMGTLAGVGTAIGWVIFGATLATAIFDGAAARDGLQSWKSFGLDILGLATFGLGKGAEAVGEGLADAGEDAVKAAAKDAASDSAAKDYLDPRAGHNAWVEANPDEAGGGAFVFSSDAMAAEAAKAAKLAGDAAVKQAEETIAAATKDLKVGNFAAFSTMSSDLAEDLSKLNAINDAVPGLAKVTASLNELKVLAGASGFVQWGSFINSIYFTAAAFTSG